MSFGQMVKMWREERGLTIRGLAKEIGVSASYVSSLEAGKQGNPSVHVLASLADTLGVPRDVLLNKAVEVPGVERPRVAYVPAFVFETAQTFKLGDWQALEGVMRQMARLRKQA